MPDSSPRRPLARAIPVLVLALAIAPSPAIANWSPFPGGVQVSSTPSFTKSTTAADGHGGMYVAWRDSVGAGNNPLWVQHLDYLGSPLWTSPGVKINDGNFGLDMPLDVSRDGADGVFVTYEDWSGSRTRAWLTRLDYFGATMSGFPVQLSQNGNGLRPAVATDNTGNAIVAWADDRNGLSSEACQGDWGYQMYAQKVDGTGHKLWPEGGMPVTPPGNLYTDLENELEMKPAPSLGGAYFVWTAEAYLCETQIKLQRLDVNGMPHLDPNGLVLDGEFSLAAQVLPAGNDCFVIWFGSGLVARRLDANGATVWTDSLSIGHNACAHAAPDGVGGMLCAWWAYPSYYVQDIDANGNLLLPSSSAVLRGTECPGLGGTIAQPCVVSDGKGGALVAEPSEGLNPPLQQVHVQGVSYKGRTAFQSASLLVSVAGQDVQKVRGVSGFINNGLFAWANGNGVFAQQVTLSDLDATTTPPGWAGPLVPRGINNSTTTFVPAMEMVEGQPTYLNWVVTQRGPNPTPAFQSRVYLDGSYFWGLNVPDGAGPGYYASLNVGPTLPIPGGPHTLTLYTDWEGTPDFSIDEGSEADDVWSTQRTWEPTWYNPSSKLDGPIGLLGPQPIPNGTGHKFAAGPGASNVWVMSDAARRGPTYDPATGGIAGYGDSYGLQLYDLPVGAAEFTHRIGESHEPFNGTNFILSTVPTAPETLYTLEVRDSVQDSNPDSCWFDLQIAGARVGPAAGSSWLGQTMARGELADVFLLNATARQIVRLSLRERESVADPGPLHDLAFEVFPPATSGLHMRGGGNASHPSAEAIDTLTFVATLTGAYEVVVYRKQGDRAGTPLAYDFQSSSALTLDAPGETPHELSFASSTPNPAIGPAELAFTLPTSGTATLSIYDVNGRRVRQLLAGVEGAGEHEVSWDVTGEDGSRVGPGLYFARLTFAGRTLTHRITVLL